MYKKLTRTERIKYTVLYFALLLFVVWSALLLAPYVEKKDINVLINGFSLIMSNPFHIVICEITKKVVVTLAFFYTLTFFVVVSSIKNKRVGEEHGSARWADTAQLNKKFSNKNFADNIILSKHFSVSTIRKKRMDENLPNLNEVILGGPGSGKTRGHVIPNILSTQTSFIVTDPKGTTLKKTGDFKKKQGFTIKVLDLKNPEKSWGYNPFHYFRNEDDVMKTVTNLFKSTTPKESSTQDPYWDNMAQEYILSFALFLWKYAPPEEQNFPMVIECIRHDEVMEDNPDYWSDMRVIMEKMKKQNPDDMSFGYYDDVHNGAARTVQSIQSTAISHLSKYSLQSIKNMSEVDELDLPHLTDTKTGLYLLLPDDDTTFNFIPAMLYIQAFQQLYDRAEQEKDDSLPMHLHIYMDEFANIAMPDEFLTILATCRSRNIGIDIILQNLSQLKEKYKEGWENIIGLCSLLKYLGGIEQSTHEWISKSLGDETICTNSYGFSRGRNGNYTTNDQVVARKLMTPEEVRTMSSSECIIIAQGEFAIKDDKYDVTIHPDYEKSGYVTKHDYDHARQLANGAVQHMEENVINVVNYDDLQVDENLVVIADEQLYEYFENLERRNN